MTNSLPPARRPVSQIIALSFVWFSVLCAYGQTYQSVFDNARALLNQKRYSEALQEAQRANALDKSQWGAYYVGGTALIGLGQPVRALQCFNWARPLAPPEVIPLIDRAIAASNQMIANQNQSPAPPAYSAPQYVPTVPPSQPPPPAASLKLGDCWEGHVGYGTLEKKETWRQGIVTIGDSFGFNAPNYPSSDYLVTPNQISDFKVSPIYASKQQTEEFKMGHQIDIRSPFSDNGRVQFGINFKVDGKSKKLWCNPDGFVAVFKYFQLRGFDSGLTIVDR